MQKILFVVLAITTCVAFATIYTGKCGDDGDDVTYSIDTSTKKLTIKGSGKMKKYSSCGPWSSHSDSIQSVTIQSGVKSIGDYAFNGLDKLTSASISSTVKKIGDYSFARTGLTSISVSSNVEKVSKHTFYNCESLKSASISSSKIAEHAFSGCKSLTSVTTSARTIEDFAFYGCSALSSISLSSTTSLGPSAFNGCSKLSSVSFSSMLSTIPSNAFWGCSSLKNVTIPESVTTLGSGAFSYCSSLSSVKISSKIKTIGSGVFRGCGFQKLSIPSGVTTLESEAFALCSKLNTVSIPDTVTSIKSDAFKNCSNLKEIVYYGTTDPVYSTGDPFTNCNAVEYVCVSKSYTSNSFCKRTVYPNSDAPELEEVFNASNSCYEPLICNETYGVLVERLNATKWEKMVSPCRTYYCDNITGPASWNKCNSTPSQSKICLDDYCVANSSVTREGWTVVINFDSIMANEFDKTAFLQDVSKITGVSSTVINYADEIDSDGFLIRVYLIMHTDATAYSMAEKLNDAISKGTCSYVVLCEEGGNITVVERDPDLDSGNRNFGSLLFLFFFMLISVFSLF